MYVVYLDFSLISYICLEFFIFFIVEICYLVMSRGYVYEIKEVII